jgi:hypothetical protein
VKENGGSSKSSTATPSKIQERNETQGWANRKSCDGLDSPKFPEACHRVSRRNRTHAIADTLKNLPIKTWTETKPDYSEIPNSNFTFYVRCRRNLPELRVLL